MGRAKNTRSDPKLLKDAAVTSPKAGGGGKVLGDIARVRESNTDSHDCEFE